MSIKKSISLYDRKNISIPTLEGILSTQTEETYPLFSTILCLDYWNYEPIISNFSKNNIISIFGKSTQILENTIDNYYNSINFDYKEINYINYTDNVISDNSLPILDEDNKNDYIKLFYTLINELEVRQKILCDFNSTTYEELCKFLLEEDTMDNKYALDVIKMIPLKVFAIKETKELNGFIMNSEENKELIKKLLSLIKNSGINIIFQFDYVGSRLSELVLKYSNSNIAFDLINFSQYFTLFNQTVEPISDLGKGYLKLNNENITDIQALTT